MNMSLVYIVFQSPFVPLLQEGIDLVFNSFLI